MVETVHRKENEYLYVGARVTTKACHVANFSEYSRRYGSASKTKFLIGVVFKMSADKLPSGYLRMSVHARFDIGGGVLKVSKVNLRSCSLAPGTIFFPAFIHTPIVSPNIDFDPNSSHIEIDDKFTLTTRNNENLLEVEFEEVYTIFEDPMNTSCNPNSRNNIN